MNITKKILITIILFGFFTNSVFAITDGYYNKSVLLNSQSGEALYNSGVANYNKQQYELAISDLLKSIELGYKGNSSYSLIAYSYQSLNDNENYLKYLTLSEDEPNNQDGMNTMQKAELLIEMERYKEALPSLNKLIAKGTKNIDIYNNRAYCRNELGDENGAIADYTKSINIDSNGNEAWYYRAELYYYNQQYNKAIYDLSQFLDYDHDADASFLRGKCKQALGNYKGAYSDYNQSDLYDADLQYRLAYCKYKLGDKYGAIADLVHLKNNKDFSDDTDTYVKSVKLLNTIIGR